MNNISIRVKDIGKQYHIGVKKEKYGSLREKITNAFATPFRRVSKLLRGQATGAADLDEVFWALEDVSFEVKRGEVVGIIGRNGAGKSTLLKILARITEPNKGFAEIYGRVGSLLEVGTGFHPELTGRENVYLNGAILGMKKSEIESKFDEIVDFSDVEKFIDTPIKHYSSGMNLRLAFAVAAHLEPEILLMDEVLAVGDASFQRKCLNKMESVGKQGRTVIFVSHNLPAVARLCERTILIDKGRVALDGPTHQVLGKYLNPETGISGIKKWDDLTEAPGDGVVRLRTALVKGEDGKCVSSFDIRQSIGIEIEYDVIKSGYVFHPHFPIQNEEGLLLFIAQHVDPDWQGKARSIGRYVSTCWIPGNLLSEGTIFVSPVMRSLNPNVLHFYADNVICFQTVDSHDSNTSRGIYPSRVKGVIRPLLKWTTKEIS